MTCCCPIIVIRQEVTFGYNAQYLSSVPVLSTCPQYLSTVPVHSWHSTCPQYLSTVPVLCTCLLLYFTMYCFICSMHPLERNHFCTNLSVEMNFLLRGCSSKRQWSVLHDIFFRIKEFLLYRSFFCWDCFLYVTHKDMQQTWFYWNLIYITI